MPYVVTTPQDHVTAYLNATLDYIILKYEAIVTNFYVSPNEGF